MYVVPSVVNSCLHHFSFSQTNQNILSSTNNVVQIGYSIINLIIAIIIVIVAYDQLNKTRVATTVQTLIDLDSYIRSDAFLKKRKKTADTILINGLDNLKVWLEKIKPENELTEEIEKLSIIKNIFESVIYQFELVGHFYKNHVFSIEDVYQLFSIEIQNYWVLMSRIGYINYLRENEHKDYYDKFENLFKDTLKQEIINDTSNPILKYFLKFYYWSRIYELFYKKKFYLFSKRKNKFSLLTENIEKKIVLFLQEEKNLI